MRLDKLLFHCAYPRSPKEIRQSEAALRKIRPEEPIDTKFSWDIARWLTRRFPGTATIDWEDWEDDDRLAAVLTPLIPELRERIVDANVPYLDYAKAKRLEWYLDRLPPVTFDLLGLWILWKTPVEFSRAHLRRMPLELFFDKTIIPRREVSIGRELASPPLPTRRLPRDEGEAALDAARAVLAVRYRELYVPTFGDPSTVISANAGRGLEIVLFGVLPEKRLPVRAGYAPFFFRNGVPVGYGDAFVIKDRIEVSFNIFPEFRDGESAWIFARLLKLYRQLFGSTIFTIDPYQLGLGNDEAIESGAFWFYRKLGFRPMDPAIERLARAEEKRKRRSSAATLRKLGASALRYP